jgi:hypothetical protein
VRRRIVSGSSMQCILRNTAAAVQRPVHLDTQQGVCYRKDMLWQAACTREQDDVVTVRRSIAGNAGFTGRATAQSR